MIKQLRIRFEGSFQCRLATERDPTNASPKDPYGTAAEGWTFAYKERKFDRIIRTFSPVELRTAPLAAWESVRVKTIEKDEGVGFKPVASSDVLYGLLVGFGAAKFDTKAGDGGMTKEAI